MNLTWQDFPNAPALGTQVCAVSDIPKDEILFVDLAGYPVLVLLLDTSPLVYVNACPHHFLPLDQRSSGILSADGMRLMCSNHQAEFGVSDGLGLSGLGVDHCLSAVPVWLQEGVVRIGEEAK